MLPDTDSTRCATPITVPQKIKASRYLTHNKLADWCIFVYEDRFWLLNVVFGNSSSTDAMVSV